MNEIKGGLIVSCQARKGWPMYGSDIMSAFAVAAEVGGAVGIRANEPINIREIKGKVKIPLIGINKQWFEDSEVYIPPTFKSAKQVVEAGADIVALDAMQRIEKDPVMKNLLILLMPIYSDWLKNTALLRHQPK